MPRHYKRRRRRPRARKKVDKVQNRRIARLEKSIEKKFVQEESSQVSLSTTVAAGAGGPHTGQIYRLLPNFLSTDGFQLANALVGNTINLRSVHARMSVSGNVSRQFRVIVFWYKQPITWSTSAPPDASTPVGGTIARPTWDQLLMGFTEGTTTASNNFYDNMCAPLARQQSTGESPISILSDRVLNLGSSNSRHWSFKKSYKSMKLAYNSYTDTQTRYSVEPVNRQLYVAIIPSKDAGTFTPDSFCLSREMTYTDA